MTGATLGVDLGGTKCQLLWVNEDNQVVDRVRFPSPDSPEGLVDSLANEVEKRPARAIGIGVPGFVDRAQQFVIRCPNLPRYVDFPLAAELSRKSGVPTTLENDANAAALAESRLGAGKGFASQILVILGSGVGGGIVENGNVYRGAGYAGEIGHLTIDKDGDLCGCGRRGCWELFASGRALARIAGKTRGEEVRDGIVNAERWALDAIATYAARVAEGLADVVLILAPQLVVLGGGVSEVGQPLVDGVRRELVRRLPEFLEPPQIRVAELGNDAGALGAALGAFKS